jgi:hypothetical protein
LRAALIAFLASVGCVPQGLTTNADLSEIHAGTPSCVTSGCHPSFTTGGTVYADLGGEQTVAGARLSLTTEDGREVEVGVSEPNGLIWADQPLPEGVVYFTLGEVTSHIHELPDQASCNTCHQPGGLQEAPGTLSAVDMFAPEAGSLQPADGATGQPTDGPYVVRFSEPMAAESLSGASVRLVGPTGAVATDLELTEPEMLRITPTASLREEADYTLVVEASVTDAAGNPLGVQLSSSFRTAGPGVPRLAGSSPASGAVAVPVDAELAFDIEPSLDPASVTLDAVMLSPACALAGYELSIDEQTIWLRPHVDLPESALCAVTLRGLVSAAGVVQEGETVVAFTTALDGHAPSVIATVPGPGRLVGTDAVVQALLDEPLAPASVGPDALRVSADGVDLPGEAALSSDGRVLTWTASSPLPAGAQLVARVAAGPTDAAGNPVVASAPWVLSTLAGPDPGAPAVVGLDPASGSTGVSPAADLRLLLSEDVDLRLLDAVTVQTTTDPPQPLPVLRGYDAGFGGVVLSPAVPWPSGPIEVVADARLADLAGHALPRAALLWVGVEDDTLFVPGDDLPPTFDGVLTAVRAEPDVLVVTWEAATDGSPAEELVYDLFLAEASGAHDFGAPYATSDPGATSLEVVLPDAETSHYVVVRARDPDGLSDANRDEVLAYRWVGYGADTEPIFLGCDCHDDNPVSDFNNISWEEVVLRSPPGMVVPFDHAASSLAVKGVHGNGNSGWYSAEEFLIVAAWIDQGALDN